MTESAQQFDWVKARADCSLLRVFNELRLGVEEDIKAMNSMPPLKEYPPPQFGVRANTMGDYFVVFRTDNAGVRVEFNCERGRIAITKGESKYGITLTLNNEGRCRLRVNGGEELEQWQVRRLMLEELFFEPIPPVST